MGDVGRHFRIGRAPVVAAVLLGAVLASVGVGPDATTWLLIGCGALSLGLMHRAVGFLDFRRVSFPSFWYFMYLATVFVPGLFLVADRQGPVADRFLLGITSGLLTVPLGMLLVNLATGTDRAAARAFFDAPMERAPLGPHGRTLYWGAVAVAGLFTCIYVTEVPTVPLFYLIRHPGATAQVVLLREDAFKLLDSPFLYWYDVLRRVGFPILTALALGWYLVGGERIWLKATVGVGALGIFFASLSLAKAPVALLILICCFAWYVVKGGQLRLRQVLIGAVAVLAFPLAVLMGLAQRADITVWVLLQAIFRRLFLLPAEIQYTYFELFPDHLAFLHGGTIGRVAWLMGRPVFDLANYAFTYMFPGGVQSGSAPASFLGFFYADFGMPGVMAGGVLAGVLMQGIHVYLLRRPKTVLTVAGYAFMYWAFWQINLAALPQTMLSGGVFFVLVGLVSFAAGERALERVARAPLSLSS